jgi:hypothetical protein
MPERIQLRRTKGWRLRDISPDAIVVARPGPYGNPYTIAMMQERINQLAEALGTEPSLDPRQMAVEAFRCDLTYGPDSIWWWYGPHTQIIRIKGALQDGELHGHDLACWCPLDQLCHADVLLEIANG